MGYRRLAFVCAFLLGTTLLLAQTTAQTPPAAIKATITGTVMKAGTGQPLKRARVSLRRSGQQLQPGGQAAQALAAVGAVADVLNQVRPGVAQQLDQRLQNLGAATTQAVTDDNGKFVFNGVEAGQYRVSVDRDGYIRQEYGQRTFTGQGTVISVSTGQRIQNVDFQLVPAGSISGRIFNEDGEALANVQVQAQAYTYQQGKRILSPVGQPVQTNDLGEYRIYWLTPGDYYISATARRGLIAAINPVVTQQAAAPRGQGGRGAAGAGPVATPPPSPQPGSVPQEQETYAPTYFPGSIVPENASPVALSAAGEIRGIDFGLRPTPTVTVSGQVLIPLPSGQAATAAAPVQGRGGRGGGGGGRGGQQVNVILTRVGAGRNIGGVLNRTNVRPDGGFEISGVIPGSYNLSATARQDGQQFAAKTKVEVSDRGASNTTLSLRPGVAIPGRIILDGTPAANFKLTQVRVTLQPTEDFAGGGGGGAGNGAVAEDGSFSLPNVAPMEYRVRLAGLPSGAYLVAGQIGSDDAVNQPFSISGDQQVSLQLHVGFSAGKVQGTVVDEKGNAFQGALAALIPEEPRRQRTDLYFSIPTDQYGRFSFGNVPPGAYKMFAWEAIPTGAHQDPDFLRTFDDRGKAVKIDANGSVDIQLNVIRQ